MNDDRAFTCSRCGSVEYETELAEKICKKCAKPLPPFNQLWEKFNAYNQFKPVCEGFYELVKKEL